MIILLPDVLRCTHALRHHPRGCEMPRGHRGLCTGDARLLCLYARWLPERVRRRLWPHLDPRTPLPTTRCATQGDRPS